MRQQAEVGGRRRAARRSRAAAGDGDARRTCWRVVERLNRSDVHDGILVQSPLPDGDGRRRRAARVRRHRSRTRTSTAFIPINVGRLVQNRATLVGLHAVRRDRAARALEHRHRRHARRRHRPQRHRRQADGAAAAAPPRDGDDLPLADARTCRASPREADILVAAIGRPGVRDAGVRQAGRHGRRRRDDAGDRSRDGRAAVSGRLEAARGLRAARVARGRRRPSRTSPTSPAR